MSVFTTKKMKKYLKIVLYGPGGSGKTTFCTTMPGTRYWVDTEHSGDKIRDDSDPTVYTTSFKDLQDAVRELFQTTGLGSFIVDPDTILRDSLIDKVESESKDGMTFRDWAKVKKPEKRFTTDWQNLPCHVAITCHEKDEYEMKRNERGKLEPVKIGVKPDADKKITYAPDLVLRLSFEDGKYFGYIEKIRIRKELAVKTGLRVGNRIENPTFDTFLPMVEEYAKGEEQAHYTDDRETSEKDEQVFTEIEQEEKQKAIKKVVSQVQRGEAKCKEMDIFGWRDDEQRDTTRRTLLGTEVLEDSHSEDLEKYVQWMRNQVLSAKESKVA